jgi:CheY-like chemotaxis protein
MPPHPSPLIRLIGRDDKPINLLLTCVVMPGMHGHELAAQLLVQRPGLKLLASRLLSLEYVATVHSDARDTGDTFPSSA